MLKTSNQFIPLHLACKKAGLSSNANEALFEYLKIEWVQLYVDPLVYKSRPFKICSKHLSPCMLTYIEFKRNKVKLGTCSN